MRTRNVLIFPAGTEIGLELFNALHCCKEVTVYGAGQDVSNHGKFVFSDYYVMPSIYEAGWLPELIRICETLSIDYIFPAYDDVIVSLSRERDRIPAAIISSPLRTCEITRSKSKTYGFLGDAVRVPSTYSLDEEIDHSEFPVFVKPNKGQGSLGVKKVDNYKELVDASSSILDPIVCEYLPGEEYTVDCFSDREKGVLFANARTRSRTRNGISVNSVSELLEEVYEWANKINEKLELRGAWFFQLKRSKSGELTLLEVAPRIAGSMATHRVKGVNFPLLSIFEHERLPLSILTNTADIELDRALHNRYWHNIKFTTLYVDLDDTLILNDKVNLQLVQLVYKCINENKKVILITRHRHNLDDTLLNFRLNGLFDEIYHLKAEELKSDYIEKGSDAIFVDDSFSERLDVSNVCCIPTFDCSMVELLVNQCESLNGN